MDVMNRAFFELYFVYLQKYVQILTQDSDDYL